MTTHTVLLSHLVAPRLERREIVLWSAAALVVLAVHGGTGWLVSQPRPPVEAEDAAPAAIMIDLAPATLEPAAVAADMADMVDSDFVEPTEEPVETAEPVTETEAVTDPVETPEVAEAVPDRAAQVEPEPVQTAEIAEIQPEEMPAEAQEVIPDIIEAPLPEVAMAIPEPAQVLEPEPDETPKPVRKPKPVKKAAEPPKPAKAPPKKKVQPPPQLAKTKSAQNAPKAATSSGSQGGRASASAVEKWKRSLARHIKRHLPSNTPSGNVRFAVAVGPGGNVLSASVMISSGNPKLDAAALRALRRSSPLPSPPPGTSRVQRSLEIPVTFE